MNSSQLAQSLRFPETGTYSELYSEYYDPVKHPTCADFRDASRKLLRDLIGQGSIQPEGSACEVGAGHSLVAEVLTDLKKAIEGLLITDVSLEMLSYSNHFRDYGASLLVADAHNLPFGDESIDVLFAILADPYNLPKYWEESARVMRPRGLMVFLVPSYVWTSKFRTSDPNEHDAVARFEMRSGVELFVPSYISSAPEQIALAREYGFECVDLRTVSKEQLQRIRSPKLCMLEPNDAVVEGYVLRNQ